jgi:hypothetical protein
MQLQAQEPIESVILTNLLGAVAQLETTNRFSVAALLPGFIYCAFRRGRECEMHGL